MKSTINPINTVAAKVTEGGPGAVTPEVIEKANETVKNMSGRYVEWTTKYIKDLRQAYLILGKTRDRKVLNILFKLAHDIKGQGGTFGYDLITTIGDKLCRLIKRVPEDEITDRDLEYMDVYITGLEHIIQTRTKGTNDVLSEKLTELSDAYTKKHTK